MKSFSFHRLFSPKEISPKFLNPATTIPIYNVGRPQETCETYKEAPTDILLSTCFI